MLYRSHISVFWLLSLLPLLFDNFESKPMTSRINLSEHNEFLPRAQSALQRLEITLEQTFEQLGLDVDIERAGGVLNVHLAKGKTIVINLQSPMQQIWLATPYGGFHYAWTHSAWLDTRNGTAFHVQLSRDLSAMTGLIIEVAPL
jgi:CyaY protein